MNKESMVYEEKGKRREHLTVEVVIADMIKQKIEEHPEAKEEIRKVLLDHIAEVNQKIADYKRIHELKIRLTDFEKTSTLKIKRFLMRPQDQR